MAADQKGRAFEEEVFQALKKALESNRLGLYSKSTLIHRGKKYHSRDRNSAIEIDVSIEMYLPEADGWSLLWAWECKDYKRPLSVDQIEEFWAKLQQIGSVNIKGGLAVTGSLQEGALAFARAKGITVVRILPEHQLVMVIAMEGPSSPEQKRLLRERTANRAVLDYDFRLDRRFFCVSPIESFDSWEHMISGTILTVPELSICHGDLFVTVMDVFETAYKDRLAVNVSVGTGSVKRGDVIKFFGKENTIIAEVMDIEIYRMKFELATPGGEYVLIFDNQFKQSFFRGMTGTGNSEIDPYVPAARRMRLPGWIKRFIR